MANFVMKNFLINQLRTSKLVDPRGFTLPEILIVSLIGAIIVCITAQVLIEQLLQGRRLEAAQRVRENFSRLNYLIQIEASEACQIEIGAQPAGCATKGGFTLWVPKPDRVCVDSANRSGIQYFETQVNGVTGIARCGPRVFPNGVLDHADLSDGSTHVTGIVVPNAELDLGCAAINAGREISYSINFSGGNFGAAGGSRCVIARVKNVFVCNPPVDASIPCAQRVGDCDCL